MVSDPESIAINLGTISEYSPSSAVALTTVAPHSDYVSLKFQLHNIAINYYNVYST